MDLFARHVIARRSGNARMPRFVAAARLESEALVLAPLLSALSHRADVRRLGGSHHRRAANFGDK